ADKQALLMELLADARPLRVFGAEYSEQTARELAVFDAARLLRQRHGAQAIRHCIVSHTEAVSDLLEVLLLQKEAGLLRGTLGRKGDNGARDDAVCDLIVVPLFETIEDLHNAATIMRDWYALPGMQRMVQRSGGEQDVM